MIKEFRTFIMRGNLVELAVAFIMGVAFGTVVMSFTEVILGAISYIAGGAVSFDGLGVKRDGQIVIPYGSFLTAVVHFVIVALVLFFVVKGYNRPAPKEDEPVTTKACPFCATDIPSAAARCPNCTSELTLA